MRDTTAFRSAVNRLRGAAGSAYKAVRKETDRPYTSLLSRSESWPRSARKAYQWDLLKSILSHAWQSVPFYRRLMAEAGLRPEQIRSEEDFRALPVLTRSDLRLRADEMVSVGHRRDDLERRLSGGSTGEPVCVYLDARRLRLSVTEEIWADRWSGWRPGEPVARLWADGPAASKPAWLRRWAREHVLSPGFIVDARRLSRESFVRFVDSYRRWRPRLVVGYASALRLLAEFLIDEGVRLSRPRAVVSSAEVLDETTRRLTERALAAPVLDRYGCREAGLLAFQCRRSGLYHVNMTRIYLEVLDEDGRPAPPGRPGKVLLTDLGNFAMPLIRYEVGDMAVPADPGGCACGTTADCLERVDGRMSDFLRSPAGCRVHRAHFNSLILAIPGLKQYRLVQESLRSVRLEIVESRPIEPKALSELSNRIGQALGGDVEVGFRMVNEIPRTPSGKLRYVESRLSEKTLAAPEEQHDLGA